MEMVPVKDGAQNSLSPDENKVNAHNDCLFSTIWTSHQAGEAGFKSDTINKSKTIWSACFLATAL